MASISERSGRFLVRVRRDGFNPVAKTFTRKLDGLAWARKVESDMEGGRWQDIKITAPTLAEAINLYRAGPAGRLKGAATYAYWLEELAACRMATKPIDAITPFDLSAWRDEQAAAGLKPGTVVRKLGLLSGLLTWCHKERGWLSANPMRSVSKPRVNDGRNRTLTDAELSALQAAANTGKAPWLADVLVVLVRSAMRRGELWSLTVEDIDFEASTCHLSDTKNGSARDVPLDPQALQALQRLTQAAQARDKAQEEGKARAAAHSGRVGSASVTPINDTGQQSPRLVPVGDPAAVSLAFRRTVARARRDYLAGCVAGGVKTDPGFLADLHLHDCRHQAVTTWATFGNLSLPELMAISGHKTPRMLVRYVSLKASDLACKMAAIAAAQAVQATQAAQAVQEPRSSQVAALATPPQRQCA